MVEYLHAGIGQMGIVERFEGLELVGTLLGGAVATQKLSVEIDAHLRYAGMSLFVLCCSYLDGGDEVLLAVCAQHADGQLGASEDDGLGKVLEHVGEGRGGVGHGVRSVQHHKAVEVVIMVGDDVRQFRPACRCHVAGIDGRLKLVGVDADVELFELWYVV